MAEIGSTLREARMRARIDISEVEARTKIRAKYLRALENEEWDLLPGSVYVKTFLRTYGDFLGVDSRLLIDEYRRRYERPSDAESRVATSLSSRQRERQGRRDPRRGRGISGPVISPWVAVAIVLVLIVAALYAIGNVFGGKTKTTAGTGGPTTPTTSTSGRHGKHTSTGRTSTTPVVPKRATLKIVPTGDIYVCVERPGGKILIPGTTFTAGEKVPAVKGPELLATLGNSNATVTINGRPYTLRPPDPIGLRITPTHVKPLSPGPTCA